MVKKIQETEGNVIPFEVRAPVTKPIPREPGDNNWLIRLDLGTAFLCIRKQDSGYLLGSFQIIGKLDLNVQLFHNENNQEIFLWVDSERFCQSWDFKGILGRTSPDGEQQQ